jgi:hypothetical protein
MVFGGDTAIGMLNTVKQGRNKNEAAEAERKRNWRSKHWMEGR